MALLASLLIGSPHSPWLTFLPEVINVQREALNSATTISRQFAFPITQKPGDIYFLHNMSILHDRDVMMVEEQDAKKRYVLRLHLRDERNEWEIPEYLQKDREPFCSHKPGARFLPIQYF